MGRALCQPTSGSWFVHTVCSSRAQHVSSTRSALTYYSVDLYEHLLLPPFSITVIPQTTTRAADESYCGMHLLCRPSTSLCFPSCSSSSATFTFSATPTAGCPAC